MWCFIRHSNVIMWVIFSAGCLKAVLKSQVRFQRDFSPKNVTLMLLQTGMTFFSLSTITEFIKLQKGQQKNKTKPMLEHSKHCSCAPFHVFICIIWEKPWYFIALKSKMVSLTPVTFGWEPVFNVNGASVTFSNPFKLWRRVISLNEDFKFHSVPHTELMYDLQRFGIFYENFVNINFFFCVCVNYSFK